LYSTKEIADAVGRSYRVVDAWSRRGILNYQGGDGRGRPRQFPPGELTIGCILSLLANYHMPRRTLARTSAALRSSGVLDGGRFVMDVTPESVEVYALEEAPAVAVNAAVLRIQADGPKLFVSGVLDARELDEQGWRG
jgi:hypothetical protein